MMQNGHIVKYLGVSFCVICSLRDVNFTGSYQYNVPESLPVASVVARIKAADADIGANAEMEYKIVDGDGLGIFKISVDKDTQEGIITIQKVIFPLLLSSVKVAPQHIRNRKPFALLEECIRQNK